MALHARDDRTASAVDPIRKYCPICNYRTRLFSLWMCLLCLMCRQQMKRFIEITPNRLLLSISPMVVFPLEVLPYASS